MDFITLYAGWNGSLKKCGNLTQGSDIPVCSMTTLWKRTVLLCSSEGLFLALWELPLQNSSWEMAPGESISWALCQSLGGCNPVLGHGAHPAELLQHRVMQPTYICLFFTFLYVLCFIRMEKSKGLKWDNLTDNLHYKIIYENIPNSWALINWKVWALCLMDIYNHKVLEGQRQNW